MITIKPYGGLGNRIRVLYSVFAVNEKLDSEIKIIWDCSTALNCPFEELFQIPVNCNVKNIHQGLYRDIKRYTFNRIGLAKLRRHFFDFVLYGDEVKQYIKDQDRLIKNCRNRSVYIETCYGFSWKGNNYDFLKPISSIRQAAEEIYKNFDSKTYGVHIRWSDKIPSLKYSSPDAYKQLVNKMIREDESIRFFLTTNSVKIEKDFKNEFQEKIITSGQKELARNSPEGIKSALVDILCLSQTKKIYGSYGSSFSSIPKLFADIECDSVISDTLLKALSL